MIRLGTLAWLGYGAVLFVSVIAAGLIAGHLLDIGYFGRPLVGALIVPPLALIYLAILHFVARIRWLMSVGGLVAVLSVLQIVIVSVGALVGKLGSAGFLRHVDISGALIAPLGLLAWFVVTVLSLALLRLAVIRHYKKCDLANPFPWAKAFYPGA